MFRNPVRVADIPTGASKAAAAARPEAARTAALVAAFVLAYGIAQAATALSRGPAEVAVWFPPAAVVFLFLLAVPARIGFPAVVMTRAAWTLATTPNADLTLVAVNAVLVAGAYTAAVAAFGRVVPEDEELPALRTIAAFFALGVGLAPLASAFLTRLLAAATGGLAWSDVAGTVQAFWIGDAVAIATLAPLPWALLRLVRAPRVTRAGIVAATVTTAAMGWLATTIVVGGAAPLYLVLVPLLASAVRYALPGAALAVAGTAAGMALGVATGGATSVASAHAFLVVAALAAATVGSIEEGRRTDRTRVQASEQQLHRMVEAIQDHAIYRLDPDGTIATWNSGARRLKGWDAAEVVGRHVRVLHLPEARERGLPDALLDRARREGVAHDAGWRMRRDGTTFWAEVTITRIDADDDVVGFTAVTRDVTARKEADDRLTRQARQLVRSNEELDRFASVASHDLQEPLRMMSSYSRLLERRYGDRLDDAGRQMLDHVVDGARRMQTLIHDLLQYSRLQSRDEAITLVDLAEVLDDVRVVLGPELERSGTRMEVANLPTVLGAPDRLHAVMQNLVHNAVKYAGDHPPVIRVAAERGSTGWQVTVHDAGEGIPPGMREEVFEPFRRLHTRGEVAGTGIGLAICRRVVEQQGGWIRAEDNEDGGTTMRIWFPDEPTTEAS